MSNIDWDNIDNTNRSLAVDALVVACLWEDGVDPVMDKTTVVRGLVRSFGFKTENLEKNKERIQKLLDQMHPDFGTQGGGASFIQLPLDADEEQWCEQSSAEALMCLGIGIGRVQFLLPRELWKALPGGVPMLRIYFSGEEVPTPEVS